MKCKIFSPEQQRVSSWSGGQTRELYIAGGAADYAARDFLLRLSSATVETEHSVFTVPARVSSCAHGAFRDGPPGA